MSNKIEQLAERRAALVRKVAMQRAELADAFEPLHTPLGYADKGLSAIRFVAQHPLLLTGAATLASFAIPKRWLIWLEGGWLAWRMVLDTKRKLTN